MSLKPPKHSEIKWLKKRTSKNRELHLDYNLIICEGTKTEPKYFKVTSKNISPKAKKYGIIEPTNKVGDLDAVESICRR